MSGANETLARRWLASKHWGGWRVGMVDVLRESACSHVCDCGCGRPVFVELSEAWGPCDLGDNMFHTAGLGYRSLPDLDHPGTRAFLLEDVRRAWEAAGSPIGAHTWTCSHYGGWRCDSMGGRSYPRKSACDTEAAALIAALEAAP